MFVDASALLAILLDEEDASRFAEAIASAERRLTAPLAIFETVAGLMRELSIPLSVAEASVRSVVAMDFTVMPLTDEIDRIALDAFDRYGKGRGHPAQLNMGDCFAYACARAEGVPLLYKGDDFGRTDIVGA
ncbi:MAG: type II toxin-antitoxin system VapC family toxin [Bauldia sp.]|nr:type II toxin-antitoxin system VapC family toxin [Bauldia sp.]